VQLKIRTRSTVTSHGGRRAAQPQPASQQKNERVERAIRSQAGLLDTDQLLNIRSREVLASASLFSLCPFDRVSRQSIDGMTLTVRHVFFLGTSLFILIGLVCVPVPTGNNTASFRQTLLSRWRAAWSNGGRRIWSSTTATATDGTSHYRLSPVAELTLMPGDLPGYTGWFRPDTTLAGHFTVVGADRAARVGSNFTVRVQCHRRSHRDCAVGGSFFYVRMYGRAILPGTVTDYGNGTYDMTVLPFDAGIYHMEVVLTFSNPPRLHDLPIRDVVAYEGYLLPGFPLQVSIPYDDDNISRQNHNLYNGNSTRRICGMSDILETSRRGAIERGRWLVTSKIKDQAYSSSEKHHDPSLLGYQLGTHSLGFKADYFPLACTILPSKEVEDAETLFKAVESSDLPPKPLFVIFVGDSNMRIQRNYFDKYHFEGSLYTEFIDTSGGIVPRLPAIKERLRELQGINATYFVLFNTGLHDVDRMCVFKEINMLHSYINITDPEFSCLDRYAQALEEFVDVVLSFPSALTVWQTTTAGWPKWGVYGAGWIVNRTQIVTLSPNTVEHVNEMAWEILSRKRVPIMDAYWLSLSRPDNREINEVRAPDAIARSK